METVIPDAKLVIEDQDLWVPASVEPAVRLVYIYTLLKECTPAAIPLAKAQAEFKKTMSPDLGRAKKLLFEKMDAALMGRARQALHGFSSKEINAEVAACFAIDFEIRGEPVFLQWAQAGWATDPESVTPKIRYMAASEAVLEFLGLDSRAFLRRNRTGLMALLPLDDRKHLRVLMSEHKTRAKQTLRKLATDGLRARGYHHRHEETLVKGAWYWIQYRTLGSPYKEITPRSKWSDAAFTTMSYDAFSHRIIAPFDEAAGFHARPGRRKVHPLPVRKTPTMRL